MSEHQKRLTAVVTGRVQGVGFRHFVWTRARRLGLTGWVRNAPDGSVHLEAEGSHADLDALLDALRHGPPAARVRDVHHDWHEGTGRFDGFDVRS